MDHIAMQGAALGITFHAAAGDYGSACLPPAPDEYPTSPMAPADSPHFVAVGATSLKTDPKQHYRYVTETAWNSNDGYAGGGGVSGVFGEPSWQKGVQNMFDSGRNYPDAAFDGDPATGTAFYYAATWNNPWNPLGGTSLASPLFGAALIDIDEIVGGRTGLAGERLFDLLKKTNYTDGGTTYFHDVTKGNNIGYFCLIGYDNVTGIGSLDVWNIAQALKK
jgi:kumamolisin